jgi:hypothetical protein
MIVSILSNESRISVTGSGIRTAVAMKISIFLDMTPYSPVETDVSDEYSPPSSRSNMKPSKKPM